MIGQHLFPRLGAFRATSANGTRHFLGLFSSTSFPQPAWETIIGEVGNYRTSSTRTSSFPVSAVSNGVFLLPFPMIYRITRDNITRCTTFILLSCTETLFFLFFFINNYLHILFAFVPFDSINLSGWAITFNKFYEFLKRRCSWLHYKIQRDCFNRDARRKK